MHTITFYVKKKQIPLFVFLSFFLMSNLTMAQDNYAIEVDNNREFVEIQNYGEFMTNGNPYTVECLFKLSNIPFFSSDQVIFGSGNYFNPNFIRCAKPIVLVGNDLFNGTYIGFIPTERQNNNFGRLPILEIPYELEVDTWYHVAFVYNGGNEFYFYVNGRRVGHATKTHHNISCNTSNNDIHIGGVNIDGRNTANLDGAVDEFRIWRKAKTEAEIQAQMYTHLTGRETDLDLYYDFDDASNTSNVIDITGNGNNGITNNIDSRNWITSSSFSSFTGAVSDDYYLAENWYNFQAAPSNVGIEASTSISNNVSLKNISISQNGSLTVTENSTFTVDSYLHTQGLLTLEEGSSLVQLDEGIVNQYPIVMKRTGNTNEFRYSYWSLPAVKSIDILYETPPISAPWTTNPTLNEKLLTPEDIFNFGTSEGQRDPYWLFLLTGTQGGFGNDADNIFWSQISQTTEIDKGFGFTLKGPLGSNPSQAKATIEGVPTNGDVTVPLVYVDNNSYLIGNPYPSAISADEFIERNNATITGTIYFWEQWSGNSHVYDEYIGGYATYTRLGGVTTKNEAQSFNDPTFRAPTTPNNAISAGQGFVVETRENTSGTIIFDNDMRIEGSNTQFYRQTTTSTNENDVKKCWINLSNEEGDFDQILIGTLPGATAADDYGLDGKLLDFKTVYAYTLIDDEKYTINALPSLDNVIPLGVATNINMEHTIELDNEEGLANHEILLKDNTTGVTHNLREASYTFTLDVGDVANRFELLIQENETRSTDDESPIVTLPNVRLRLQNNGIAIVTERTIEAIQVSDLSGHTVYTDRKSDFIKKKFEQGFYIVILTDSNGNHVRKKVFIP
ncbi:concanavalin A-like lectin/glucanase superfamily protein [Kordia periserrulae]|uniref:Concanavalin A-like lectin/glucanase superfamily protein n=2 Tax=Kordia periserrulae TaxID=701523 RepID=A0A2T6C693_9FLAO|nr:concanavalin A-like lectin/glucanase superfamily protein [Kordia periserrulae]